jgi:hypothetical protein
MSATGQRGATGRRHPMTVVAEARRMADGGWTPTEIRDHLVRRGVQVTSTTIARWTNAKAAKRQAAQRTQHNRAVSAGRSGRLGNSRATPEFKLARMRALREQTAMRDAQIARLMAFDFGDVMSRDAVNAALANNRYPSHLA